MNYCERFTEAKFDIKSVNTTVKSTTEYVCAFKSNQIFGTKHSKTNCKSPFSTKQITGVQNV